MTKIKIVGYETEFDLANVEHKIVKLSDGFYFKHDTANVIKVNNRFYRKQSPLVVELNKDTYALKKDCVPTVDGAWLIKNDPNTIKVNGGYTRKNYTTLVEGTRYLLSDPLLCKLYNGNYWLKSDSLELSSTYYRRNTYVKASEEDSTIVTINEERILKRDSTQIYVPTSGLGFFGAVHHDFTRQEDLIHIAVGFRGTPSPDNIIWGVVHQKDTQRSPRVMSSSKYGPTICFLEHMTSTIITPLEQWFVLTQKPSIDAVKKAINSNYSDQGTDENQADIFSLNYTTWGGGHVITRANSKKRISSKSFKKTGGLSFSFGVEFETAAGLLSQSQVDQARVDAVGDRSIGAAEYVTGVLHSDSGVDQLKVICDLLASNTLVDNRCATHIHIGCVASEDSTQLPYSPEFSAALIKIGALIEEDLFKISPSNRSPEMKHCHSILAYKNIDANNWKEYLGRYIFGPKENWDVITEMKGYRFGSDGRTMNATLGKYSAGSRYKWLNLIHATTSSYVKTVEIRMWAGTTSFNKTYNQLLISMALVKYTMDILATGDVYKLKALSLEDMLTAVYKEDNKLLKNVLEFVKERKNKFNRTKIYNRKPCVD